MSKEILDFSRRPQDEQDAFLNQTWCNECMEADLGMVEPEEYKLDGNRFVEGKCKRCGNPVVTELVDDSF